MSKSKTTSNSTPIDVAAGPGNMAEVIEQGTSTAVTEPASQPKTHAAYDAVPYPSAVFPHTHPGRLAMIARLFHLDAPNPQKCRVLELGCAQGTNIIPMAVQLPESEFFGVDLSEVQIKDGQKKIAELGLKNVRIEQMDITELSKEHGQFDFIITHGIYSWVPEHVRQAIMRVSSELLAPNGVVFLSYNANPGWKMRGMVRDMMLYHTRNFTDIPTKITQARALVKFLAESLPAETPYGAFLQHELKQMETWRDDYFFHDSLEEVNVPFYIHEVIDEAHKYGLQYLGDSELHSMFMSNYPKNVQENLKRVGTDIVATEQYMDFLRNRMFRQTLFIKEGRPANRNINSAELTEYYVSARIRPENPNLDLLATTEEKFNATNGRFVNTNKPWIKAAFVYLSQNWSQAVPYTELLNGALEMLADAEKKRTGKKGSYSEQQKAEISKSLGEAILYVLTLDMVSLHVYAYPFVTKISEKPAVHAFSRYEAEHGRKLTNMRHELVDMDLFAQHLITLLDGTRTKRQLAEGMMNMVNSNKLSLSKDNIALHMHPDGMNILLKEIDTYLDQLCRSALLIK